MKKLLAILLALVMVLGMFTACTPKKPGPVSSDIIDTSSDDDYYDDDEDFDEDEDWDEDEDFDEDEDWDEDFDEDEYDEDDEDDKDDKDDEGDIEDPYANLSPVQLRANNIQMGEDAEYIQAGIIKDKNGKVVANNNRMKKFIEKLHTKGQNVKVCYFGGENISVDSGYTDRFTSWLDSEAASYVSSYEASFPGIVSTDAIYRVKHDVIDQKPDLVVLDFAVQDSFGGGAKNRAPIFENMVRRILAETDAAVVIVSNIGAEVNSYRQNANNPDPMVTAAEYHHAVAEYYGVPFIDFYNATWDIISLLVDKRPYGQVPVCSWGIFGESNTDLTNVGHINLAEMLKALVKNIEAEKTTDKPVKLGKVSDTSSYLYKNNSYMTYDYIDAMDIYLSTDVVGYKPGVKSYAGYSMENKKGASLAQYSKKSDYNGTSQCFQAFRPLLSAATADVKEAAPLIFNIPEVTKENKAYIHVAYDPVTGPGSGSSSIPFALVRITCYDKNGKIIGGEGKRFLTHPYWLETPQNWTYDGQKLELKEGTVKVVYEMYAGSGYIQIFGIGRTQTIKGKVSDDEIY